MRSKRKAISPIIATLILIVITVIAGIFLYSFVSGYLGTLSSTTSTPPNVQISPVSYYQHYDSNTTYNGVIEVTITNVGSTPVSIVPTGSFYFANGTLAGSATLVKKILPSSGLQYLLYTSPLTLTPGQTVEINVTLVASSPYTVAPGYSYYLKFTTTTGYTISSTSFIP